MTCSPTCRRPTPGQAHCGACHLTFSGVSGFDRHRRGGACLDPAAFGFHPDERGVWRAPAPQDGSFRVARPAAGGRE